MLGKKLYTTNEQWVYAYEHATDLVPIERIAEIETKAIMNMTLVLKNFHNPCNGWCGGKDSIVLEHLLRKACINSTPIQWQYSEEFPIMQKWYLTNRPANCIVETLSFFDLDFLETHNEYLFCKGEGTRNQWISKKWAVQKRDIKKYGFDVFITGRRIMDGNSCGSRENKFIVPAKHYTVFNPIAEWSNEELLAYIRYNRIKLPPNYSFSQGFVSGSGAWTDYESRGRTDFEVFDELYENDPEVLKIASSKLTVAREYLKARGITSQGE